MNKLKSTYRKFKYNERIVYIMENKEIKSKVANTAKNIAIKVATHYANVACPFFTYQPKMSNEVKNLRKF